MDHFARRLMGVHAGIVAERQRSGKPLYETVSCVACVMLCEAKCGKDIAPEAGLLDGMFRDEPPDLRDHGLNVGVLDGVVAVSRVVPDACEPRDLLLGPTCRRRQP